MDNLRSNGSFPTWNLTTNRFMMAPESQLHYFLSYSSPPILRGFWDEKINRVKSRNWGGGPRKTGDI